MKKILFVCHGNICRSAMAEFIMKDLVKKEGMSDDFYIESAATSTEETGNDLYPPAKQKLREKGIPFACHYARQVTKKDYKLFDYIFVMDSNNQRNIKRIIPNNPDHKIHLLLDGKSIADPWYTDDFETTYQDILKGCQTWLDRLIWEK
ncbi:low molecular weight protein-tyrosine-phosphatase [uncultured Dubosiella sp.]|uniref:low molecular weight protein-tyrosine-phosphatase n=1 Tax=uncultured Dubosiella sp. TaxID=1937011 RepID=UPI00261EAA6E|nr:low molecular weight protein-tyrosine-phosphatase [uncultured Dubosiella sp.]